MIHIKTFDQLNEAVPQDGFHNRFFKDPEPGITNFIEVAICTMPVELRRPHGPAGSPSNPLMETVSVEPFGQKKSYGDGTYPVKKLYVYRIAYPGERYADSEFPDMMLHTVSVRGGDYWKIKYDADKGSLFSPYPASKIHGPAPVVKMLAGFDGSMAGVPLSDVRRPICWRLRSNVSKSVELYFDEHGRVIVENSSGVVLPEWDGRVVSDAEMSKFFDDRWYKHGHGHGINEEQLMPFDVEKLAAAARTVKHCGDYGRLFIRDGSADVFWTIGDADSPNNGFDDDDEIKRKLMAVDGVDSVEFGNEATPNPDDDWMEIDYSSEN